MTMRFSLVTMALGMVLTAGCATTEVPPSGAVHEVDSSLIKTVEYDDITEDLTITFHDGDVYRFRDVPGKVYNGLMSAKSKGNYYHRRIKDKYEGEKK
jgi:lysyl-tRNA synthetase class 2